MLLKINYPETKHTTLPACYENPLELHRNTRKISRDTQRWYQPVPSRLSSISSILITAVAVSGILSISWTPGLHGDSALRRLLTSLVRFFLIDRYQMPRFPREG